METESFAPTRKQFLLTMAGATTLRQIAAQQPDARSSKPKRKLLIVVAHPDDEYAFTATTYRLIRELGWLADQVIITNGEAGYRYATLASAFYGVTLDNERDGRAQLPAIRKEEAVRAGKILGIRNHYFLDQRDLGFSTNAAAADWSNWDRDHIVGFLSGLLAREQYDAVFTLLPTEQTHAHHRAATLLALRATSTLPEASRPLVFGVEPRGKGEATPRFKGLPTEPESATFSSEPCVTFDRATSFGYANAVNYQVVVNWVIAEHKSQGRFQMDAGHHSLEQFWLFEVNGASAPARTRAFVDELCAHPLFAAR